MTGGPHHGSTGPGPWGRTFAALRVRNFRLYFAGQSVSLVGTWMQGVAQSWLVLQLTGSGTVLGAVVAAQFLPVLVAGPYGGLVADRADKRRLLMATQTVLAALALLLGVLTVTHLVRLWMVVVLAVGLGLVNAVDNPTRQTFVPEVVGPELLRNAVILNSVMTNAARAVGPALAGILIAEVGVGVCFLANAASFVAVLWALAVVPGAERVLGAWLGRLPERVGGKAQGLLERAAEAMGPLNLLVNNASVFREDTVQSMTRETWDAHMETNLRSPLALAQTQMHLEFVGSAAAARHLRG